MSYKTVLSAFQMISPHSYVNEIAVRMLAMRKLQKSVTIMTFPSHTLLNLRLLFISASNARMRFIENIQIKCFTTFCIQCNRCPWFAKTRWTCWLWENSNLLYIIYSVAQIFKILNLSNIYIPFLIRTVEGRINQLSVFAFRQNAQVTMEIILYDIVNNVIVFVITIVVAVITFITWRFRTFRSWSRKRKLIWFKRLSGKL